MTDRSVTGHTLRRLVQALKVTLAGLCETREAVDNRVEPLNQRKVFHTACNQLRSERLGPDLVGKRVKFLRMEFDPAAADKVQSYAHEGGEYGIIIREGSRCPWTSRPPSSVLVTAFSSTRVPSYVVNAGRSTAVTIWAIAPPTT